MSEKYLRVTMPDGSKWDVPAIIIVEDKVKYFKFKSENVGVSLSELDRIREETIASNPAVIDWAFFMYWSDVVKHAQKVQDGEIDYQDGWVNGAKEVVEK